MATVTFQRGNTEKLQNIEPTNGLVYFNTDDLCIYLDNGTTREIYGGKLQTISDPSTATSSNVYSATASNNLFCQKNNVADSGANINNNTQVQRPIGCTGFKDIVGVDADYNYENRTTVKGYIGNLQNRLKVGNDKFVFGNLNGQWGFYTDESRGADTFHPFSSTMFTLTGKWYSNGGEGHYLHQNGEIKSKNVELILQNTTSASTTALPIDLVDGNVASRIIYHNDGNTLSSEYIIHIFDDKENGSHNHYVFPQLTNAWKSVSTAKSPLGIDSEALMGVPFVLQEDAIFNDYHYKNDILYFYVVTSHNIKIYRYTDSNSNLWSGTWAELTDQRFELNDSHYTSVGGKQSCVVYNNKLHLLGGDNGEFDKNHYIWSPINGWEVISNSLNYDFEDAYGTVVHNNQIWCFAPSTIYIYDKFNSWTTKSYDKNLIGASFIEYNGEIHILGGTSSNKRHIKWIDSENNFTTENEIYTNLAYPFVNGCACLTPSQKYITSQSVLIGAICDIRTSAPMIHYMGTSVANPSSGNYRKKHYTLIDTYNARIYND